MYKDSISKFISTVPSESVTEFCYCSREDCRTSQLQRIRIKRSSDMKFMKSGLLIFLALVTVSNLSRVDSFVWTKLPRMNAGSDITYTTSNTRRSIQLFQSEKDKDIQHEFTSDELTMRRLDAVGVSVSKFGFLSLLSISSTENQSYVIPVRITSDQSDYLAANSVEALTYIQLLGYGIDMASAGVFPPRILHDLVALHCTNNENAINDEGCSIIQNMLERDLPEGISFYDANPWLRSRVKFPKIELDCVKLELIDVHGEETSQSTSDDLASFIPFSFILECRVEGKRLNVLLCSEILPDNIIDDDCFDVGCEPLQAVSYQYGPASAAFTALSLALRYQAPLSISNEAFDRVREKHSSSIIGCDKSNFDSNIRRILPRWRSTGDLKGQTERIEKNLMQGFEANKLEGALRIAIEKGDEVAAQKIRERLGKFDSFDDLPTSTENSGVQRGTGGFQ